MERIKTSKGELPVNYGMNAMAMFSEERSIGINDVFNLDYDKLNFMDLMALLYVGLKDGARKAGEECKFKSLEEFLDFADEESDVIGEVASVFAGQQKESKGGEAKKK